MHRVRNVLGGACGAGSSAPPVIVDLFGFVCRQSVPGERLDKREEVPSRFFGYIQGILVKGVEHITDRMLPVKEFPHVDAGGAQAKTMPPVSGSKRTAQSSNSSRSKTYGLARGLSSFFTA